ncbi:MAG: hypothetical protein U0359_12965, partial [Byssovorax sp.]
MASVAQREKIERAPSPVASLERSLDRTIEYLVERAPVPESRALLIEARRLRSVVANWRSLAPDEAVYQDMVARTLALSLSSGASLYDPAYDLRAEIDPLVTTEEARILDLADDPEAYLVDFEPYLCSLSVLSPLERTAPISVPETAWSRAAAPPRRAIAAQGDTAAAASIAASPIASAPIAASPIAAAPIAAAPIAASQTARPSAIPPSAERPARAAEPAAPHLRVVKSTGEARAISSHPPEKAARSYPPEVFDDPPADAASLASDEAPLTYPPVPSFAPLPSINGEGELVYPALPPVERGTTGMLRAVPLPGLSTSQVSTTTPAERAFADDAGSRADRPRTLRPPMPELELGEAAPAPEAPTAPPTKVEVVVL